MGLSRREKGLIGLAGAALVGASLWSGVYRPLLERRADLTSEREVIAQVADRLARIEALGIEPTAQGPGTPLLDRVSRRAEAEGILLLQIVPEAGSLRVTTGEVAFGDLMVWLTALSAEDGVTTEAASLARQTQPGMVSARLTLGEL